MQIHVLFPKTVCALQFQLLIHIDKIMCLLAQHIRPIRYLQHVIVKIICLRAHSISGQLCYARKFTLYSFATISMINIFPNVSIWGNSCQFNPLFSLFIYRLAAANERQEDMTLSQAVAKLEEEDHQSVKVKDDKVKDNASQDPQVLVKDNASEAEPMTEADHTSVKDGQ